MSTVGRNTSGLGVGTGTVRRIGREGSVLDSGGSLMADVIGVEWSATIEQVPITITGSYQDESKPGAETRTFTLTVQKLDDYWERMVWTFIRKRRAGLAVAFPKFAIQTKIATPGVVTQTRWALNGCQIYSFGQSMQQSDGALTSQIAGTYDDESPIDSFEYTGVDGHGALQTQVFAPATLTF